MRVTRRQLRQILTHILKESALLETPLDGYFWMPADRKKEPSQRNRGWGTSVGYRIPIKPSETEAKSAEDFEKRAKVLMSDTKDNFIIVTNEDVARVQSEEEIMKEIIRRGIRVTPDTKILVILSEPLEGDYDSPDWVVAHDIIGHSIENYAKKMFYLNVYSKQKRAQILMSNLNLMLYDIIDKVAPEIHKAALAPEMMMSSKNNRDMLPDIFAAILLKKFDKDEASRVIQKFMEDKYPGGKEITDEYERDINFNHRRVLNMLLRIPSNWVKSLKPGINELSFF